MGKYFRQRSLSLIAGLLTALALAATVLPSREAKASPITFLATGTIVSVNSENGPYGDYFARYFSTLPAVGDSFEFQYTFESSTPNMANLPLPPDLSLYGFYPGAITAATLKVGTNPAWSLPAATVVDNRIGVAQTHSQSAFYSAILADRSPTDSGSGLPTASLFLQLPLGYFATDALPLTPPEVAKLIRTHGLGEFSFVASSGPAKLGEFVDFDHFTGELTSFTLVTGPLPPPPPPLPPPPPPPPPKLNPFSSVQVSFPLDYAFGAQEYFLSFDGSGFLVDLPFFLTADAAGIVPSIANTWFLAMYDQWGKGVQVEDQYGQKYPFEIIPRWVGDEASSLGIVKMNRTIIGSTNPPCRELSSTISAECVLQIPRVEPRVSGLSTMQMFDRLQTFCYGSLLTAKWVKDCPPEQGVLLMDCLNPDGSIYKFLGISFKCKQPDDLQPLLAAHEFGHLLGLPDEYAPNGTRDILCVNYPISGDLCLDLGIMEALGEKRQPRYFEYLFSALDQLTTGFSWEFALSPSWISDFPAIPGYEGLEPFEIPVSSARVAVSEPRTIALLAIALAGLGFSRRRKLH